MAKIIKKIKTKKTPKKSPLKKRVTKTVIKKSKVKIKSKPKKVVLKKRISKNLPVKLERNINNPIIKPSFYPWESKATFNPSAFESNGKIHIVYRAIGEDDSSVIGYASSYDGLNIEERPTHSIYQRFHQVVKIGEPIDYISGGGWGGGCEDPRLTLLEDTVYMLYTAFDGWGSVRIAMTSIKLEDFKKKKWNWEKPVTISPPGEINKNWVLFPEKINGKFAILHSISPEVMIEFVDNLNYFNGKNFIYSINQSDTRWQLREKGIRGVGPSPIKTKLGWLVLYHAIEDNDPNRYKLFAMILDKNDPTKILYRSKKPILEPDAYYENEGYKSGVIYSCGAVIKDGTFFVYYGGADMVTCVASIELDELLESLKKDKFVKLRNNKLQRVL